MHWADLHERVLLLFTIEDCIPKLDVAGSIPISRSKRINGLQLHRGLCTYILVDIERMAELVGHHVHA
jgi:hypothetical protein